jgi:hypothetical protein
MRISRVEGAIQIVALSLRDPGVGDRILLGVSIF